MIELVDLTKEYPGAGQAAVEKLSLVVETGETMALLGPSGCGKTSVLNMIVGLEKPTAGDIRINGESILKIPAEKRGIGLVFQDYAVFTSMTVRKNLAFGLEIKKIPKKEIEAVVAETADFLGLTEKLDLKARGLSGSELQRVAIGRTLATKPAILLLDEPLSNLETEARLATRQELRRLRRELGLTVIYVTHDQVEALSLADRLAIMSHGQLLQVEKTAEILERPQNIFVAQFLGSPPMNVFSGFFHSDKGFPAFRVGAVDLRLPGESLPKGIKPGSARYYYLGVRPEDLRVARDAKDAVGVNHGKGAKDENTPPLLEGVVTGLESRGHDRVVRLGGEDLEIKALAADRVPDWGDQVALWAPREKFFLFDAQGRLMAQGI
jgi:multiple sugar transport system ATP-binding protein